MNLVESLENELKTLEPVVAELWPRVKELCEHPAVKEYELMRDKWYAVDLKIRKIQETLEALRRP